MNTNRPTTQSSSFNDTQLVEISGASVHTPGERAKPRPTARPREAIPLADHPTQIVESETKAGRRSTPAE